MDIKSDLYFLIAKFLEQGPCIEAAEVLKRELEKNQIIPTSVNWLGEPVNQDFNTYSKRNEHVGQDHLEFIYKTLLKHSRSLQGPNASSVVRSLLSKNICSPLKDSSPSIYETLGRNRNIFHIGRENQIFNVAHLISGRSIYGTNISTKVFNPEFFTRINKLVRSVGHLSAVYCVLFDNTGKFVITGADDTLVKIWSALDGRLLATLRGASAEIADIAINNENTLLAVGSCDKIIRVWCLATCAPVAILQGQGGSVTSIFFCPIPNAVTNIRFLASTSSDGSCAFWAFTTDEGGKVQFQPKPTIYNERMRPGACQMICSSFSTSGLFFASGSADCNVRVYYMLGAEGPERILEVECHTDRVDSISWAHKGLRFISGSKDGTALIWRFEHQQWKYIKIFCSKALPGQLTNVAENPKNKTRVTMVAWNLDDSLAIVAVSNYLVKIYNPKNGNLVRVLEGHQDEAFIIEPHPKYPSIVCTAGHDGRLIIWDIGIGAINNEEQPNNSYSKGKILYEYFNELPQGQGHGSIFDMKWSPDGLSLVATDSHGHVILFGATLDSKFERLPTELFFHTDYRPLFRDAITHQILDEQTQIEPHLMPPPFLVDTEGNPYPPCLQRLVPGRGNCKDEQLIPNFAMEDGRLEIIEGIPLEENNPPVNDVENIPVAPEPIAAGPVVVVAGAGDVGPLPRSNIDELIEQLAIEIQVPNNENENNNGEHSHSHSTRNNRPSLGGGGNERRGLALRRSGDVEGVRQSRGNWQRGTFFGFRKKYVVNAFTKGELQVSEDFRMGHFEVEEEWYKYHNDTAEPPEIILVPQCSSSPGQRRLREREIIRTKRLRRLASSSNHESRNGNLHEADEDMDGVEEGVARPNPPQQERTSYLLDSPRRRNLARRPPTQGASAARRRVRYVRRLGDAPDDDNDDDDVEAIPSDVPSDSSSESDPDWGTRTTTREPESRSQNTSSSRRRVNRNKRRSSNTRDRDNSADNDDSDDEKPGPSSSSRARKSTVKYTTESPKKGRKTKNSQSDGLDEIEEPYRPSEWLSDIMPKRNPYFPQLNDDLVYFRQGHELYIEKVVKENIYQISKRDMQSIPYIQNPQLPATLAVRVVSIEYELVPPRIVSLKLSVNDWKTGEPTDSFIYVKYHDTDNIVDFFVLRQIYDKSLRHNWNRNDRFRCLINGNWFLGKILFKSPYSPQFPESKFLCYSIEWENDEDVDACSPWDLDIIPDNFDDSVGSLPASQEDLRAGLYEIQNEDWPPLGHQDAECQRISRKLEAVMELAISEAFLTPVDLNVYPEYAYEIEYPMDLSTIKNRLDNHFYRRQESLIHDFNYIKINAEKFNEPKSEIIKRARVIRDLGIAIANDEARNVNAYYKRLMVEYSENSDSENHSDNRHNSGGRRANRSNISNSSNNYDNNDEPMPGPSSDIRGVGRGTSKRRSRNNFDDSHQEKNWQDECHDLLEDLWKSQDAGPFRKPVDIIDFPDYYNIIEIPMDLLTIKEDLAGGNYSSPTDFARDLKLIFSNSRTYNTNKKSKIYSMTLRLQSRCDVSINEILSNWKNSNKRSIQDKSPGKSKVRTTNQASPRKFPSRTRSQRHDADDAVEGYTSDEQHQDQRLTTSTRPTRVSARITTSSPLRHSNYSTRNNPGPSSSTTTNTTTTTSSGRVIRPVKRLRNDSSSNESAPEDEQHPKSKPPATKHSQQQPVKKLKVLLPVTDNNTLKTRTTRSLRNTSPHHLTNEATTSTSTNTRPRRSTAGRIKREVNGDDHHDEEQDDNDDNDEEFVPGSVSVSANGRPRRKTAGKNRYLDSSNNEAEDDDDFSSPRKSTRRSGGNKSAGANQQSDSDSVSGSSEVEVENDEAKIIPNIRPVIPSSENEEEESDHEEQEEEEEEDDEEDSGLRRSKRPRKPVRKSYDSSDSDNNTRSSSRRLKDSRGGPSTFTPARTSRATRNRGKSSKNYEEVSD